MSQMRVFPSPPHGPDLSRSPWTDARLLTALAPAAQPLPPDRGRRPGHKVPALSNSFSLIWTALIYSFYCAQLKVEGIRRPSALG